MVGGMSGFRTSQAIDRYPEGRGTGPVKGDCGASTAVPVPQQPVARMGSARSSAAILLSSRRLRTRLTQSAVE